MKHPNDTEIKGILTARFHLYAIIGCIGFTAALSLITRGKIESEFFLITMILMMIQVELFAWIGIRIFKPVVYTSAKEVIRKVVPRLGIFYLFVVIVGGLLFVIVNAIWSYSKGIEPEIFFKQLAERELRGFIIGSSFGLLIGTVIYFFLELIAVIDREQKLNEEKMRYHYETLKNQMNPHFLFNSLNIVVSLMRSDPPKAEAGLHDFADLFRVLLAGAR